MDIMTLLVSTLGEQGEENRETGVHHESQGGWILLDLITPAQGL